ncbi:unnamed protein product [Boreogadus saida]
MAILKPTSAASLPDIVRREHEVLSLDAGTPPPVPSDILLSKSVFLTLLCGLTAAADSSCLLHVASVCPGLEG